MVRGRGWVLGVVNIIITVEALGSSAGPHGECDGGAELRGAYTSALVGSVLDDRWLAEEWVFE